MDPNKAAPFRLLIVEDNVLFRQALCDGMRRRFPGAELPEAGTVAEGYRVALETRPNLVFIDIGLPDGSGLALAERLHCALPDAVLAVCTSHDLPEYREAARRCGVARFFGKQRMEWGEIGRFVEDVAAGKSPLVFEEWRPNGPLEDSRGKEGKHG